jgi:hypothetical protein
MSFIKAQNGTMNDGQKDSDFSKLDWPILESLEVTLFFTKNVWNLFMLPYSNEILFRKYITCMSNRLDIQAIGATTNLKKQI